MVDRTHAKIPVLDVSGFGVDPPLRTDQVDIHLTAMQAQKLQILIGAARAVLKRSYEAKHRPINLDIVVQADLHCRCVAGVPLPYAAEIEALEALEQEYENLTGVVSFPRWRARRMYMQSLIDSGAIRPESMDRAAEFVVLINNKLAGDIEPPPKQEPEAGEDILQLLHPVVVNSSWAQFSVGHLRDAVLNAHVALGDLIRQRTGLTQDGKALVEQALSMQKPLLVLSNLDTESGRNDQAGFMQIISGAFVGIRNPKAHSLEHDLDTTKAAQYLVFASLLARRIVDAKSVPQPGTEV